MVSWARNGSSIIEDLSLLRNSDGVDAIEDGRWRIAKAGNFELVNGELNLVSIHINFIV